MNATERRKAIENAVALAATNPLVPAAVRVGIAALAEEVCALRADLEIAGQRIFQLQGDVLRLQRKGN